MHLQRLVQYAGPLATQPRIPLGPALAQAAKRRPDGRLKPINVPQNPATWQLFTNNPTRLTTQRHRDRVPLAGKCRFNFLCARQFARHGRGWAIRESILTFPVRGFDASSYRLEFDRGFASAHPRKLVAIFGAAHLVMPPAHDADALSQSAPAGKKVAIMQSNTSRGSATST